MYFSVSWPHQWRLSISIVFRTRCYCRNEDRKKWIIALLWVSEIWKYSILYYLPKCGWMPVDVKMIFSPCREAGGEKLHKKGKHKKGLEKGESIPMCLPWSKSWSGEEQWIGLGDLRAEIFVLLYRMTTGNDAICFRDPTSRIQQRFE